MKISEFIDFLSKYKTYDTIYNMYYGNSKAAIARRERLKEYLVKHKDAKFLLLGDTPDISVTKTGAPFAENPSNPLLKNIQSVLSSSYADPDPDFLLVWNALPFFPHKKGDKKSRRTPSATEFYVQQIILDKLLETFPNIIFFSATGKGAKGILDKKNPEYGVFYIDRSKSGDKTSPESYGFSKFSNIMVNEKIMCTAANSETEYHYLKEHQEEFFDWHRISDHAEYDYQYFNINNIDLAEYQKWPAKITETENAVYLGRIKPEYIQFADFKRLDPYYDSAASDWTAYIELNVHGWKSNATISDNSPFYKKLNAMLNYSKDFECKSKIPEMYGEYWFTRKNTVMRNYNLYKIRDELKFGR